MDNFQRLDQNFRQLLHMKSYFKDLPHKLAYLGKTLQQAEKSIVLDSQKLLEELDFNLKKNFKTLYSLNVQTIDNLEKSLRLLSPENTLARGYAITTTNTGKVLRSVKGVVVGDNVGVRLSDGTLGTVVKNKHDQK